MINKIFSIMLVLVLFGSLTGCVPSVSNDQSNDSLIISDSWYYYKELDIVNFKNCYVTDAYVRKAGNVFVTYQPVCKFCKETGTISSAIVSEEESYMNTYYCNCGEQTTLIIKIVI